MDCRARSASPGAGILAARMYTRTLLPRQRRVAANEGDWHEVWLDLAKSWRVLRRDDPPRAAPDGRDRRSVRGVRVGLGGRQFAGQATLRGADAARRRRRADTARADRPGLHGQLRAAR